MADPWDTPMLCSIGSPYIPLYFGASVVPWCHRRMCGHFHRAPFLVVRRAEQRPFYCIACIGEVHQQHSRITIGMFYVVVNLDDRVDCGDAFFISALDVSSRYVHDIGEFSCYRHWPYFVGNLRVKYWSIAPTSIWFSFLSMYTMVPFVQFSGTACSFLILFVTRAIGRDSHILVSLYAFPCIPPLPCSLLLARFRIPASLSCSLYALLIHVSIYGSPDIIWVSLACFLIVSRHSAVWISSYSDSMPRMCSICGSGLVSPIWGIMIPICPTSHRFLHTLAFGYVSFLRRDILRAVRSA